MAVPIRLPFLIDRALGRAMAQIDRVLQAAAATGHDARDVAERVKKYLSPHFAPRRTASGDRVRADRPGALGDWPAASGMGSQGVRLIATNETSEAYRHRLDDLARQNGDGVRWVLSGFHSGIDVCDSYATADGGYGPGVYLAGFAPSAPHPGCGCDLEYVPLGERP